MLRQALAALLLTLSVGSLAQARPDRNSPPRPAKAAVAAELSRIDSAGDAARSIDARMRIAEMLKGKEALGLLHDAAARADSIKDHWRGSEARTKLVERYRAAGDHKRALVEALRIIELERTGQAAESEREAAEAANLIRAHQQERDSLIALRENEADSARASMSRAQEGIATREKIIIGAGVVALVLAVCLIIILLRQRKARKLLIRDVQALQAKLKVMAADIEGLAAQAKKPAAPSPPAAEVPASSITEPAPSTAPALDPMALALFKRQAPERIMALQTARAAGDHQKALRVLHSLRPQLDALDPGGLGALCARSRSMQPSDAGWDAGLDQLVTGINALLARS